MAHAQCSASQALLPERAVLLADTGWGSVQHFLQG